MNYQRRSFIRKVAYLVAMALLLVPISMLSRPATSATGSRGGVLAQQRSENHLAQGNLGKIDPTSSAMDWATFGMRGVAALVLWERSNYFKKTEDWANFQTTLDQISYLQPNFVSVWRYQAWNMSFNVSAEWDDYRDRYYYVVEGIKYLDRGQEYNRRDTRLLWDEGWFTGHKVGRSDEFRQFRLLWRQNLVNPIDSLLPERYPQGEERDNWRVARLSFEEAVDLVDTRDVPIRGTAPVLFYSEPAKCTIRYIAARESDDVVERDGRVVLQPVFGRVAQEWWRRALEEWDAFGDRGLPTTLVDGETIRLNDRDRFQREYDEAVQELEQLLPGVRQKLLAERKAALSREDREVLETPVEELSERQRSRRYEVEEQIKVEPSHLAAAADEPLRERAAKLADRAERARALRVAVDGQRQVVNFDYWRERCVAEGSETGIEARELLHLARLAYDRDPFTAKEPYEKAFARFNDMLASAPWLIGDGEIGDDLIPELRRYNRALQAHDLKFSENVPWEHIRETIEFRQPSPPIGDWDEQTGT